MHEHFYSLWKLQTTRMVDGDWKEASEWLVGHLLWVDFRASCWVSCEPGCLPQRTSMLVFCCGLKMRSY